MLREGANTGQSDEDRETRLKRMKIRSWRRGIKEMDLILGPFADGALRAQNDTFLDAYDALLNEYDQDLYMWFSGQTAAPAEHQATIETIMSARA
ncbi:MAG: succinate dehydrogenase assembly factor 2 [Pseudomonadota bacterium]